MKSGFVTVAGRPNVGKSTLVNALCGAKVAITSTVPNTTRRRIFGVANGADYQLALVDLPGFQRPIDPLTERMQQTVDASFDDVDAVLLVVDARAHIGSGDRFVARRVFALGEAGRHRAEQGRPAEACAHRVADEGRGGARRLPCAPPGEREDEGRRRRAARATSSSCSPRGLRTSRPTSARTSRSRSESPRSSERRRSTSRARRCRTPSPSRSRRSRTDESGR